MRHFGSHFTVRICISSSYRNDEVYGLGDAYRYIPYVIGDVEQFPIIGIDAEHLRIVAS